MKLNLTAFLIKEGLTESDILSIKGRKKKSSLNIDGTACNFYWKTSVSTPKWVELFSGAQGVRTDLMEGKSVQGLLIMKRQNRLICFTFGHARHFIEPLSIERYFGFKVALSMSDPELIKSIGKTNIDQTPFRSESQSSKYVTISEFEFKFDSEILKSLTGVVNSDSEDDYELISGTDSVSLYTEATLSGLPEIADRLLTAYSDDEYKRTYPWIDNIVPIRDKNKISELDQAAIDRINSSQFIDVWAAPPEQISFENFSGFCYRKNRSANGSQTVSPDLSLESCLAAKRMLGSASISKLKSTKISLLDANEQEIKVWPLYICLNAEVEVNGENFLLSEGVWYELNQNFVAEIESYFTNFEQSDIQLPPYNGEHEAPYLLRAGQANGIFVLDQKFIQLTGASSKFEFCDLLTTDNEIIHVKKYSSSSVLSHLFSQAYVSAESLIRSPEVIDQVNRHLSLMGQHRFTFDRSAQPRPATIVLAIMQQRVGDIHMPFFSKVNFRQYSQRLIDMGYSVKLKKIAC